MLVSSITNFLATFTSSAPDLAAVTVFWEAAATSPAVHTAVRAPGRLFVVAGCLFASCWALGHLGGVWLKKTNVAQCAILLSGMFLCAFLQLQEEEEECSQWAQSEVQQLPGYADSELLPVFTLLLNVTLKPLEVFRSVWKAIFSE